MSGKLENPDDNVSFHTGHADYISFFGSVKSVECKQGQKGK
jgi:hypothetical protein